MGRISTDWELTPGESFRLSLTVPPGATAYVELPGMLGARILQDGKTWKNAGLLQAPFGARRHELVVSP